MRIQSIVTAGILLLCFAFIGGARMMGPTLVLTLPGRSWFGTREAVRRAAVRDDGTIGLYTPGTPFLTYEGTIDIENDAGADFNGMTLAGNCIPAIHTGPIRIINDIGTDTHYTPAITLSDEAGTGVPVLLHGVWVEYEAK